MPSSESAAARFEVTVDLPTPPLPEPTHTMFFTAASAPVGSPSRRPRRCWSDAFSCCVSTSKPTFTSVTSGSFRRTVATPVSNCERIGEAGVMSDTTTSTRPSAGCSTERTIPRSTMLWRSSGAMTTLSAWVISSRVGIRQSIVAGSKNKPARPRRTPPAEGGEILHCRPGYEGRQLYPGSALSCGRGEEGPPRPERRGGWWCGLNEVRHLCPNVLGRLGDARLDTLGSLLDVAGADVAGGALHGGLEVARVALHEAVDLDPALAQAALQLGAGPLELTLELVAGGGATTLVALDALRELTLSGGPRHVRLDRLDHVVAGDECRADRDQHGTLRLSGERLDREILRLQGVDDRVGGFLGRRLRARRRAASRAARRVGAGGGRLALTR